MNVNLYLKNSQILYNNKNLHKKSNHVNVHARYFYSTANLGVEDMTEIEIYKIMYLQETMISVPVHVIPSKKH